MQLIISGKTYDLAGIAKLSLLDLIMVKKETGMTLPQLETRLDKGLDDPEAFGVIVWLSRVHAGEKAADGRGPIKFHEAIDFPFSEIEIVLSDEEKAEQEQAEADALDPTSPPEDVAVEPAVLVGSNAG